MPQSNTLFIIKDNTATPVDSPSFKDLGIVEVQHLQEWIRKYPQMLGEELLIIQKEFRGFAGTNERLDLLALDKDGYLVVIENKRDDSGADVTWQALKYVSYCSTLTPEGIEQIFQKYLDEHFPGENAEQKMREFFGRDDISSILDQDDQRMILVAMAKSINMPSMQKGMGVKQDDGNSQHTQRIQDGNKRRVDSNRSRIR